MGQDNVNNLTAGILIIIKLKQLGIKEIVVRSDKDEYVETLKTIGATKIITPLSIAAEKISKVFSADNVIDYFNIKNNYDVYEIKIGDNFEETRITELSLRSKYNMNILLIERKNKIIYPTNEVSLLSGDNIFIFGKKMIYHW